MMRWSRFIQVALVPVIAVAFPIASRSRLAAQESLEPTTPLVWGFATTGLGAAGAGQLSKSGLVQCLRVGGAFRFADALAFQVTGLTSNVLLTSGNGSLTDPRPPVNNLNGLVASVDFMDGIVNGSVGGNAAVGVGGFRHRTGDNTGTTYLGLQVGGEGPTHPLAIGDLTAGGYITVLPESHGNTEWMLLVTFGVRVY